MTSDTTTRFSARVRAFIRAHLHSIEDLEVLLYLRRHANEAHSAVELAGKLTIPVFEAEQSLEQLVRGELARWVGGPGAPVQYSPVSSRLAREVGELADAYNAFRPEILVLISKHAIQRVRTDAMRTFGQAFLLRSPKKSS